MGAAAGKFLGVRRIYARISSNFPENFASQKLKYDEQLIFLWRSHTKKLLLVCVTSKKGLHVLKSNSNVFRRSESKLLVQGENCLTTILG